MEERNILELKHISKQYTGVKALDDVSISFRRGEVHALMGENGAGKSTLIKTLSGAIQPNDGEIVFEGTTYTHMEPHQAMELGIHVIYQEFNMMPELSVAENIFMGQQLGGGVLFNKSITEERAQKILDGMHVKINAKETVKNLSVANMQLVEIAKALTRDVKVLVMDEPTAPLTDAEVETLFEIVQMLKSKGVTIIYISHRIAEVFQISDRVSVLRDGRFIKTVMTNDVDRDELIRLMVGREVSDTYPKRDFAPGEVVLELRDVCGNGVENVSFAVRSGEIFGLSGLVGAGRTETMRMIFGADPIDSGEVLLNGQPVHPKHPAEAVKLGIGLIPEDRKQQGLLLDLPIFTNISMATMRDISHFTVVNSRAEKENVNRLVEAVTIKTPSIAQLVRNLSGGNQQKVVLAKWLSAHPRILIFDNPTQGVDVGAKEEIYEIILRLAAQGVAVAVLSSEAQEIIRLCDRVLVMYHGRIAGELAGERMTEHGIMVLATGGEAV